MIPAAALASSALALAAGAALFAQSSPVKRSDSVPTVRFIGVQPNVKLEVLDWGGTGRPMVLLAGLGNTAHVFEELARALRTNYHVYGVTRRGFGRSSMPDDGYSAERLGDDVLAVLDSLHLAKPVLVGHSIAGEELSSIGSRHGDRVSALIYLDAIDSYAFYDTTTGNAGIDLIDLQRKLYALQQGPPSRQLIDELLEKTLPTFQRDLRELRDLEPGGAPPAPPPAPDYQDRASFASFRAWRERAFGYAPPIAELREQFEEMPDGSVGRAIRSAEDSRWVSQAILAGLRKHLSVSAPVLTISASPSAPGTFASPAAKAAAVARDSIYRAKQEAVARRAAPIARTVQVAGTNHYIFLTNEADVVREINAFLRSLPDARQP